MSETFFCDRCKAVHDPDVCPLRSFSTASHKHTAECYSDDVALENAIQQRDQERERCAKIAESFKSLGGNQLMRDLCDNIAAVIRRGT